MDIQPSSALRPADLAEPYYYLHNARTLLHWVLQVHDDLLLTDEKQQLQSLFSLPEEAQALLFRMVMRKGEWFRSDQLNYAEISAPDEALRQLEQINLIDLTPSCDAATLARLCRKDELLLLCDALWPDVKLNRSSRKQELQARLLNQPLPTQPLRDWWPAAPFRLIRLSCMPLMDRMRLMFFGNLHQDWSEFVLTELGHQAAQEELEQTAQPEARVRVQRILQRSAKKAGREAPLVRKTKLPLLELELLPSGNQRVEALVIQHLQAQGFKAWHVENQLFTGLFALLFWPALFAPVKGAFFHPFQSGPADLYHADFARKRQSLIDEGFRKLEDGRYREAILNTLKRKHGLRCNLVHWPSLDTELVTEALTCIPAEHLGAIFRHLLLDLRHHRRGLPDLICLNPEQEHYQLIEVKGPNDRLQDHQRLWMEFFITQGITATLCRVRFPA